MNSTEEEKPNVVHKYLTMIGYVDSSKYFSVAAAISTDPPNDKQTHQQLKTVRPRPPLRRTEVKLATT